MKNLKLVSAMKDNSKSGNEKWINSQILGKIWLKKVKCVLIFIIKL